MQCTTSFLCDSCSQTTTAPAPRSTCFLLCASRNAKMHACPVPAAGLLCPAMLLLLALLAAPPAVAAVNMSTYGALRVSVVREPHHRLPVLARQHSSAGVRLPGFRGRVRQGQRIPVELLLEFPGYGYLLQEQLLHIFMHYICLCLNMCHQSSPTKRSVPVTTPMTRDSRHNIAPSIGHLGNSQARMNRPNVLSNVSAAKVYSL